jgi:hypothetical protein
MLERIQVFVANLLWYLWLHPCRWVGHRGPYIPGAEPARTCTRCWDTWE